MTISCLAAEDILLSRISSIEGSIVVVRKLNTCEAVLFSGINVVVFIPLLLLILSADEVICNYEIKCYRLASILEAVIVQKACRAYEGTSSPFHMRRCSRDNALPVRNKAPSGAFKLNNIKSIPSIVGYLQCRWLIFPFRYLMCL